jgi:glycosyltransferase involved in cell wall biosynthesis
LYGDRDKNVLSRYIDPAKIFVAKNTLDTDRLFGIKKQLEEEGRDAVKHRLGFAKKFNFVFIGRLLTEKLPQCLVEMVDYLPSSITDHLTIHFVGDGPARKVLKTEIRKKDQEDLFTFHGSVHDDQLTGSILFAADIMILPGEVGLSVNHAFCFDCPVVTFERKDNGPFHGPEEEYIINGVTGYKIKDHSAEAIAKIITFYLSNTELQNEIRNNVNHYVQTQLSIANMVEGVVKGLNYVQQDKRNKEVPFN